jgi:hypothetical protein
MRRVLIFLGVVTTCWLLANRFTALYWLAQLVGAGSTTEATVVGPNCNNHGTVRLSYVVADKNYTAAVRPGTLRRPCDDFKIGEKMQINYLPTDPAKSLLTDPNDELQSQQVFWLFASIAIAAIVALGRNSDV